MMQRSRATRRICSLPAALRLLAALPMAAAMPAVAKPWKSETDAIGSLWAVNQRPTLWSVDLCDNFGNMPVNVQAVATNTASGLPVLQVRVGNPQLTDNVAAIARALLGVDLGNNAVNQFIPDDPNPNGPILTNAQFWDDNLRSAHTNGNGYLPAPNFATLVNPPNNCPASLAAALGPARANRRETLDDLNAAALTNKQRWHCYAHRFQDPANNNNAPPPGFVEVTHFEFPDPFSQYPLAEVSGRFVFDYTQGRVYYTPAHYHLWNKKDFSPVQDGVQPDAGSVCNPFFQIVP
jgi:hypothetical protein